MDRAIIPGAGGEDLDRRIFTVRRHRVMLDEDLAALYGVTTKALNQAVKRNPKRFPAHFAFRLLRHDVAALRSQFVTANVHENPGRAKRRNFPLAFTEHGAVMLACVLNSPVAIQASIEVVQVFIRVRELAVGHRDLARRLDEMEKKYDSQFRLVFAAVRALMAGPDPDKPGERIGFK